MLSARGVPVKNDGAPVRIMDHCPALPRGAVPGDSAQSSSRKEHHPVPHMIRTRPSPLLVLAMTCGMAALVWVTGLPQAWGPGLTWDEAYYHPTYVAARDWTGQLLTSPSAALTSEGIEAGWDHIPELPPVAKWLGALSLVHRPDGWWNLASMRVVPALAFGATLWLMWAVARRFVRGWWALAPPLLYATMPRVFGHAQLAATETLFALATMLVIWAALRDLSRWPNRLLLALLLGLALATKINGLILLGAVAVWLLVRTAFDGRLFRPGGLRAAGPDLLTATTVILLAPLVAFAIWPWLWDQTAARLAWYYEFVREHIHQGVWYFGRRRNFGAPLLPVTYPFVITHLVVPVVHLLLFWVAIATGLGRIAAGRPRSGQEDRTPLRAEQTARPSRWRIPSGHLLLAACVMAPFVASSLPGVPKYDGERLFFPMFAPAALLTGIGLWQLWFVLRKKLSQPATRRTAQVSAAVLGLLAATELYALRPVLFHAMIDFYNAPVAVTTRNADFFPFEQTYWGNGFTQRVYKDLNDTLPEGARVKTLAIHPAIFPLLQDWGILRGDILFNPDPPYDAHLMQNRKGFWGNAEWTLYTTRPQLQGWGRGYSGEPFVLLYDGRPPVLE